MNPTEEIDRLRETAIAILPGFKHARAQLDIAVHVLEYFERHAAHERNTGTFVAFKPPNPEVIKAIENLKSMLNVFCRLHAPTTGGSSQSTR